MYMDDMKNKIESDKELREIWGSLKGDDSNFSLYQDLNCLSEPEVPQSLKYKLISLAKEPAARLPGLFSVGYAPALAAVLLIFTLPLFLKYKNYQNLNGTSGIKQIHQLAYVNYNSSEDDLFSDGEDDIFDQQLLDMEELLWDI